MSIIINNKFGICILGSLSVSCYFVFKTSEEMKRVVNSYIIDTNHSKIIDDRLYHQRKLAENVVWSMISVGITGFMIGITYQS